MFVQFVPPNMVIGFDPSQIPENAWGLRLQPPPAPILEERAGRFAAEALRILRGLRLVLNVVQSYTSDENMPEVQEFRWLLLPMTANFRLKTYTGSLCAPLKPNEVDLL